jgi:hypothetical protein
LGADVGWTMSAIAMVLIWPRSGVYSQWLKEAVVFCLFSHADVFTTCTLLEGDVIVADMVSS